MALYAGTSPHGRLSDTVDVVRDIAFTMKKPVASGSHNRNNEKRVYTDLKASRLERKAARDLILCIASVVVVGISAYVFDLANAVAVVTGLELFRELNPTLWVITFAVWALAIFVLRRVEDLYAVIRQRGDLERHFFMRRKTDFLAKMAGGIVHDINNAMTAIRSLSEVAEGQLNRGASAQDSVRGIATASDRATGLLRHLTDFVQEREVPAELLQLCGIVRGVEPILRHLTGDGVQLKLELDDESGWVRISRTQMEEVIMNLVINAVHAMSEGGGTLTVRVDHVTLTANAMTVFGKAADADYVRLTVRDTGEGIATKELAHIFDPYFTTKEKGCGLGLSVVQQIVARCAGVIQVDSRRGHGSSFTVCLPRIGDPVGGGRHLTIG